MVKTNPFIIYKISSLRNFLQVRSCGLIILFMVLSFAMAGCVTMNDPEASQEYNSDSVGTLDAKSVIGQSFISRRPKLNGITIWFTASSGQENAPVNAGNNFINLELFHSPRDASPVFSTSIIAPISGKIIPITIQI